MTAATSDYTYLHQRRKTLHQRRKTVYAAITRRELELFPASHSPA
jgi:hypothetical protein